MKKRTQILLQQIRDNLQQIKNHKIFLIFQFKNHYRKQPNEENNSHSKNNPTCHPDIVDCRSTCENDISDKLKTTQKHIQNIRDKDKMVRKKIYDWIADFGPTHFLTVQFPKNMRSSNFDVSKNNLRRFMARFEQYLVGSRWTDKHVRFYAFAEKSRQDGYSYHFHVLLNSTFYSDESIKKALDRACFDLSLSLQTYYIEGVEDNKVIYYCLKSIKTFDKTDWYDYIIPSNILFGV